MKNLDASDDPTDQVMAVEVFNPPKEGAASGRVWDAPPH
jgi:endo-1,4-beta-xylanase